MTLMFPKPSKPERGTAACRRHMAAVAQLGCILCRRPAQVHHCIHGRCAQRRASDFDTIPLCPEHHDELHLKPAQWRSRYGPDTGYLPEVRQRVEAARAGLLAVKGAA